MNVDLFELPQFSVRNKGELLFDHLEALHEFHYDNCVEYNKVCRTVFPKKPSDLSEIPFLPVSLFKTYVLKSIADDQIYKTLTSSGTTGSVPSKIVLDRETAKEQTKSLSKIMTHVLGKERLPMLIVDSKSVITDRKSYSARGAGILGLSVFGKKHKYLLDQNFEIDVVALKKFMESFNGEKVLIFGFTFMVWKYLFLDESTKDLDLSNAILIHSGGWKKLQDLAVDNDTFKQKMLDKFGLQHIYNFYGMVEQVGSVFLENEKGYLHCPNFSDIIIRNPKNLEEQPHGVPGLIQVISVLPKSYPGHSILTEDIGICHGEDDLEWKGKYFQILGRAKKAELRGCSDTFSG